MQPNTTFQQLKNLQSLKFSPIFFHSRRTHLPNPSHRRLLSTIVRTRSRAAAEPSITVNHHWRHFSAPQAINLSGAYSSSSSSSSMHGASLSPSASFTPSPNLVEATTLAAPFSRSSSPSQATTRASNTPSLNPDEATVFPTSPTPPPSSSPPLATHVTTPPTAPEPSQHQPSASHATNDAPDPPRRRSRYHLPWHSVYPSDTFASSSHTTDGSDHAASSASAESRHDQQPLPTRGRTYRSRVSILPPECHLNGNLQLDTTTSQNRYDHLRHKQLVPCKCLSLPVLDTLRNGTDVTTYFHNIGLVENFDISHCAYYELVLEFYSTFHFHRHGNISLDTPNVIRF
ncbi:hypothetical protein V6Z12_A13G187100 [Gossypium hirsutum]